MPFVPIPSGPGIPDPQLTEATVPHEPYPPHPDQTGPEQVSPTGSPTGAPVTSRAQSGQYLTTAQGVRVADTDHSLKAGTRGPTLLQDHHLREKITHFDHERIPERVVHARGAAAHGTFRSYGNASQLSRASFLAADAETPVFVRFSNVVGSRGSADSVRDTRGFAVKFYTDEGTFDMVGNNMPVFFIQDGIKFPDLVHAAKPTPDREIPQAQSAHDTFWDFVSLHTEATNHVMWQMSDRGIPRSWRTMEGFGVHTFKLVAEDGSVTLVKFHWKPIAGVHSFVWEEAQLINGIDPDFHRRDLADAIESGAFPMWELGIQTFPDTPEQTFEGIDLLDSSKLVPEELAPVQPIGLLTLNANPLNYFAETEQVAFHPGHLVPGIDVTDDPLMAARLFSYLDTQISRLGGPNFSQIPINRPHAPVNDMLRDGAHQVADQSGVAPYKPNSLDGGCPFIAGSDLGAYIEVPQQLPASSKVRELPTSFSDHFSQPRQFWLSLSPVEQDHTVAAYTFELGKCYEMVVKQRQLQVLANIDGKLASRVAAGLGLAAPTATVALGAAEPSAAISQVGRNWPIVGRVLGIIVADDSDLSEVLYTIESAAAAGVIPLLIAPVGGTLGEGDDAITVQRTLLTASSVEFDALVVAGAPKPTTTGLIDVKSNAPSTPPVDARVSLMLSEAFRHSKAIGGWGPVTSVLEAAAINPSAAGIVTGQTPRDVLENVFALLGSHRVWERFETAL